MPEVTERVLPSATWKRPSAPSVTSGTVSVAVEPEPLTRTAPVVSVSELGFRPPRPLTEGIPESVLRLSARSVWLPESEFAPVALKTAVAEADRMLVAEEYPV